MPAERLLSKAILIARMGAKVNIRKDPAKSFDIPAISLSILHYCN